MKVKDFKHYPDDALLTSSDVREMLQVSRPTFLELEKEEMFPSPMVMGKTMKRWYKKEIDEWLKNRRHRNE